MLFNTTPYKFGKEYVDTILYIDQTMSLFLKEKILKLKPSAELTPKKSWLSTSSNLFIGMLFLDFQFIINHFPAPNPWVNCQWHQLLLIFGGHVGDSHRTHKPTQRVHIIERH